MPEPSNSPKPPSSNQSKQANTGVGVIRQVQVAGLLVVGSKEPREYKFEVDLFNSPNDPNPKEVPWKKPFGQVDVHYIPDEDEGAKKIRHNIQLARHSYTERDYTVVFEDRFDDINWKNSFTISLQFHSGTIKHYSEEEVTLKICDKPDDVLEGTYQLLKQAC